MYVRTNMKEMYIIIGIQPPPTSYHYTYVPKVEKIIIMRKVHLSASARTNNNSQRHCP